MKGNIEQAIASFLSRWASPEEAARILDGYATVLEPTFRLNPFSPTSEEALAELERDGFSVAPLDESHNPTASDGMIGAPSGGTIAAPMPQLFTVPAAERSRLTRHAAVDRGDIYLQNPASMWVAAALDVQPHMQVLDFCAAPGSKTLGLAAAMRPLQTSTAQPGDAPETSFAGELVAMEVVRSRFFKRRANLGRLGITGVRVLHQDGRKAPRYRPAYFDRILLDAPCSSEGRIRWDTPESYQYWSPKKHQEMQRKQRQLLDAALQCLKPGGSLVYATCALNPFENAEVVSSVLSTHDDVTCGAWTRTWPDAYCQGFSWITLRRADELGM